MRQPVREKKVPMNETELQGMIKNAWGRKKAPQVRELQREAAALLTSFTATELPSNLTFQGSIPAILSYDKSIPSTQRALIHRLGKVNIAYATTQQHFVLALASEEIRRELASILWKILDLSRETKGPKGMMGTYLNYCILLAPIFSDAGDALALINLEGIERMAASMGKSKMARKNLHHLTWQEFHGRRSKSEYLEGIFSQALTTAFWEYRKERGDNVVQYWETDSPLWRRRDEMNRSLKEGDRSASILAKHWNIITQVTFVEFFTLMEEYNAEWATAAFDWGKSY